jgi:hypothetical protein
MNWLNRFIEKKIDLLATLAPSSETQYQSDSKRGKSLATDLPQTCPKESLSADLGTVGQNFQAVGQNLGIDLPHLEPASVLTLPRFVASVASVARGFDPSRKSVWDSTLECLSTGLPLEDILDLREERAGILEYDGGMDRSDAERCAGLLGVAA